jgi:hypothetical protein
MTNRPYYIVCCSNNPKCTNRPLFNFEWEPRARFCYEHKQSSMINVVGGVICKVCPRQVRFINGEYSDVCLKHSDIKLTPAVEPKQPRKWWNIKQNTSETNTSGVFSWFQRWCINKQNLIKITK